MKKLLKMLALILTLNSLSALADGAMASDGSIYRVAANISDANEADKKAMDACKAVGGGNCKIIARFTRGCWAVSKDRQLGKSAPAVGYPSIDEAKGAALKNCSLAGGMNCITTDNQGCEKSSLTQQNWPKDNPQVQNQTSRKNNSESYPQGRDCNKVEGWWSRLSCRGEEANRKENEAKLNSLKSQCDNYGFQRGTNEHAQCMMQLQAQENANAQAAEQRNAAILKPPPMVDLTPDVINNKSIDCVSTVRNNKVYTNCN